MTDDGTIDNNLRAATLIDLITNNGGGAGGGDGGLGGSARMGVGYIVEAATMSRTSTTTDGPGVAQTWDGDNIDPQTAQRMSCDADLYAILLNQLGQPTAVGRTRRSATRDQRLALRALYNTCAIDGTTPFRRCEIHHVNVFFEHGGKTELDNLIPISPEWHHHIHDRG